MVALIVLGVIALIGGGLLLWGRASSLAKAQQLKTVAQRTVSELKQMAKEVAGELGRGSYNEMVGLRGTAECDNPLKSELSGTPCLYYRMSVTQEYEEEYEEWDEQRKARVRRTRRGSRNLASNTRSCPFMLRDDTGAIEVMPDGADIDAERVLSSFEPEQRLLQPGGMMLSFGSFSFAMGGMGHHGMGMGYGGLGSRTLGYRLEEYALPVGRSVYVMGEVSDAEGRLAIQKPSHRSNKFVISTKSKEALVQATQNKALFFLIGAIVSFLAGGGMLVGGIVSGLTG